MGKIYNIQDLVDIDRLQTLFENFSKATGFTTGFVSYPEQQLLITTGWRDICTKFHRVCPASSECCKESNVYLTSCLKNLQEFSFKRCGNGLVDGATPVIIRGMHLASLATGQVLLAPPDLGYFKGLASHYGYAEDEYLAALSKVPVVTEEQLKSVLAFLNGLAVQIAEEGLRRLQIQEAADGLRKAKEEVDQQVEIRTVAWQQANRQLQIELAERNRAEKALQKAHDELESVVRARTAEICAANAAIRKSEASLRVLSDSIPNGIIYQLVRDDEGNSWFKYISAGIERLYGIPAARALADAHSVYASLHPDDAPDILKASEESARTLSVCNVEGRIVTPSGEVRWMHWRSTPRRLANGNTISDGIATDITERKEVEEALNRAHRTLRVLKECDEVLVRAASEQEMLDRVCRILMDIWGARLAWAGIAENDAKKTVRVAAYAGSDEGYLEKLAVTWADEPRGRGPTGTAISTQRVIIIRDIPTNPHFSPWREDALKQGYASMIALPLISENHCLGALTIYSTHRNAFNDEEGELLQQLAGDLTYGIIALRTRAERNRLQGELLAISERTTQFIAQELHDGICQHLAGTAMMSKLMERQLAEKCAPEAEIARQICELLRTGLEELRNLSHGLHPVKGESNGLMDGLKIMAETVTKLFHIRCSFRCTTPVYIDSEGIATHLFRIAQEAVNNAIKHGRADRVHISLCYTEEGTALSIRDNGVGIPQKAPSTGMGMQIMKYRASTIGATVSLRRAGKRGTLVRCILPFPA